MTLHVLSTLVVLLVVAGVLQRRHTARHMRLMTAAFAADVALVLYIEGTRHAVATVVTTPRPLVWFHAGISTLVLALYVAQLSLGRRLLNGRSTSRRVHIALGLTFLVCRGLNYATAFLVSAPVSPATAVQAAASPVAPPASPRLAARQE
jgi:hypothetical protein